MGNLRADVLKLATPNQWLKRPLLDDSSIERAITELKQIGYHPISTSDLLSDAGLKISLHFPILRTILSGFSIHRQIIPCCLIISHFNCTEIAPRSGTSPFGLFETKRQVGILGFRSSPKKQIKPRPKRESM